MPDAPSPWFRVPHPGWLVLAAVVLGVIAAALVLGPNSPLSGPDMSGHRWAVYPSTGNPAVDGDSEQAKLAFEGNVKVFSVLYTEQDFGEPEQVVEARWHVVLDLPPDGRPTVRGSGSKSGFVYKRIMLAERYGRNGMYEGEELELRFHKTDRTLSIQRQTVEYRYQSDGDEKPTTRPAFVDRSLKGPFDTRSGNVIVVRLSADHEIVDARQTGETITDELKAADVERIVAEGGADGQSLR